MGRKNTGSQLRIKERLVKAFRQVVLIASVAAVAGAIALMVVNARYSNALVNYGFSQGDIGKAMISFAGTRAYMLSSIGSVSEDAIQTAIENHDAMKAKFVDNYWPTVADTLTTADEWAKYEELSAELESYWETEAEVISMGSTPDSELSLKAQELEQSSLEPIYDEVYTKLLDLMNVNVNQGDSLKTSLSILSYVLLAVIAVIILFATFLSTKLGNNIAQGIADPINALADRLKTFAQGDLSSPFPAVETQDEIADMTNTAVDMGNALEWIIEDSGRILKDFSEGDYTTTSENRENYRGDFSVLLTAMQALKSQMRETLKAIEEASSQVSAGSNNLSEASQGLAEGATEQAGAVEELQATIGEITENIEKAANDSRTAYEQAKKYAEEADNSKEEMQGMVAVMARINDASNKIGDIISEIEDIASQTNLLSLNASIEAARAGEAGRGFAVVAEQIRQLSDQSKESALNTRELIERELKEVEEGNKAADHVAASMDAVVQGVNMVAQASKQVSERSLDQARAMREAEEGMNQISEVVQSNSAAAQESSATSEELYAQAETLDDLIRRFKL